MMQGLRRKCSQQTRQWFLVCPVCALEKDTLNRTLPILMGWCMQKQVEKQNRLAPYVQP
jgi:hypothetical protein